MRKLILILVISVAVVLCSGLAMAQFSFDGQADNSLDSFGYYYGITGGLFPTGTVPNGNGRKFKHHKCKFTVYTTLQYVCAVLGRRNEVKRQRNFWWTCA